MAGIKSQEGADGLGAADEQGPMALLELRLERTMAEWDEGRAVQYPALEVRSPLYFNSRFTSCFLPSCHPKLLK